MIELSEADKKLILACKGHNKKVFRNKKDWVESLKVLFIEIYGWNPDYDNNYNDYLRCIFNKLLEIYLKIKENFDNNRELQDLFINVFSKQFDNEAELPIERGINKLCSLISFTTVINNDGTKRFNLE